MRVACYNQMQRGQELKKQYTLIDPDSGDKDTIWTEPSNVLKRIAQEYEVSIAEVKDWIREKSIFLYV